MPLVCGSVGGQRHHEEPGRCSAHPALLQEDGGAQSSMLGETGPQTLGGGVLDSERSLEEVPTLQTL